MSINEIETEVERLSLAEQEELLRHLEAHLRRQGSQASVASRQDWVRRLHLLRASIGSGSGPTLSAEQILAESREE